jgi:hypothetical protein
MTDHGRATVAAHLPYLRRYARALTGSQAAGDACVRGCLEALLADPARDRRSDEPTDLFVLFHKVHERGLSQGSSTTRTALGFARPRRRPCAACRSATARCCC